MEREAEAGRRMGGQPSLLESGEARPGREQTIDVLNTHAPKHKPAATGFTRYLRRLWKPSSRITRRVIGQRRGRCHKGQRLEGRFFFPLVFRWRDGKRRSDATNRRQPVSTFPAELILTRLIDNFMSVYPSIRGVIWRVY